MWRICIHLPVVAALGACAAITPGIEQKTANLDGTGFTVLT